MAVIVPIVKPLVDVVKQLAAALNETRAYLGLPPVDADALIEQAFSGGPVAHVQAPHVDVFPPVSVPPAPKVEEKKPEPQDIPTVDIGDAITDDVPADGVFYFNGVDTDADGNIFDDIADGNGYFKAESKGGVATFAPNPDRSMQAELLEMSSMMLEAVSDFTTMPMMPPIQVVKPGEAKYKNGKWIIVKNIQLT